MGEGNAHGRGGMGEGSARGRGVHGEGSTWGGECMGEGSVGGVHGGGMQGRIQDFEREGAKVKTRGMHIFGMFNAFCCGMYCTTSIGVQSTLFLVKAVYAL